LTALLCGCAGLALHRVFALDALLPVLLVAALGPAVVTGVLSTGARRRSLWLAAPGSLIVWLLVAGATVLPADAALQVLPTPGTLRDIASGLSGAWIQLLSTILPAPPQPELLVATSALVWLLSAVAAELAVRTRGALLPVVPALLLFAAGVLLGVTGPGGNLPVAAGFVVLCAALAVARQPDSLAVRATLRRYALGLPVIACVTLVATLLGPRLPLIDQRKPFDLRHYVVPAARPQTALNPLDQVSAWLASPGLPLFTAAVTAGATGAAGTAGPTAAAGNGAPSGVDWRIASLDAFDGQTWSTTGRFVSTGQRVPATAAAPTRTTGLDTTVTTGALTGLWLPAAESPTSVTGTPVEVDPQTGVLLDTAGLRPGLRYSVTSRVPEYGADQLRFAVPADDAQARAALELPPGLPDSILDEARRATEGATFPSQQAIRLESYLRAIEKNDPTAAPGHTYGHLTYFLTVSHRGTTEQFATAFAVMARSLGLPTRVAVGFGPGLAGPDGTWTVRGSDALVWPEVDFRGIGWVPFYPTPVAGSDSTGSQTVPAGATSQRQEIDDSLAAMPITGVKPPPPPVPHGATIHDGRHPLRDWWPLLALVPAVPLLGYLGAVLLVPALRRRRRRAAGEPAARVAGAWAEALDRLGPLRLGEVSTLTIGEVVDAAGRRLAGDARGHLDGLAALADAGAFSGVPPDDPAGVAAWRHVDGLTPAVRRAVGRRALLRYRLRPAALRRTGHGPR
jgi:transglutaminase-like putative cysteine protease